MPDDVYKSLDAVGEGENWWEVLLILHPYRFFISELRFSYLRPSLFVGSGATKAYIGT